MTVTIYGMPASTCTQRLICVCEELSVPYKVEIVDLMKGDSKTPEHLARQPFGKIPALQDGDLTMFESRAIMRYLASKYGKDGALVGQTEKDKAMTENWLEVESQNYAGPVGALVYETLFKSWFGQTTDPEAVVKHTEEVNKVFDVYESILSKRPFMAGDFLSLADLSAMPYTHYMVNVSKITSPMASHPSVKAWFEKVQAMPCWQKTLAAGKA